MDRAKSAPRVGDLKRSGMVPRHGEAGQRLEADPAATSQLRPRFALESEREPPREREPGFLDDEPEDGVPTPRPRMPLGSIPKRLVSDRGLLMLPLDHRAGFVLSHIDGATDVRTLIDICGMTHDEVFAVIERLLALRAIAWS